MKSSPSNSGQPALAAELSREISGGASARIVFAPPSIVSYRASWMSASTSNSFGSRRMLLRDVLPSAPES